MPLSLTFAVTPSTRKQVPEGSPLEHLDAVDPVDPLYVNTYRSSEAPFSILTHPAKRADTVFRAAPFMSW